MQLEVGARGLAIQRVVDYAAIARRLGAKLIRLVIDDAGYHPDPKTVTALLREAVPFLNGLTLGIENHDRFPAATLRAMIEAAGSDRIGVCLDTANSLGAGEGLDAVVKELGPLTVNLHIKDFHIVRVPHLMGFNVEGRPAGHGFLNLPRLLEQLAPFNRCRTAVLELWTPPDPCLEDTISSPRNLRRLQWLCSALSAVNNALTHSRGYQRVVWSKTSNGWHLVRQLGRRETFGEQECCEVSR